MKEERVVLVVVATVATAAAAAILLRRWHRSSERRWKRTQRLLRRFASECATPVTKLWEISDALVLDMKAGLSSEGRSKLPMLVSMVDTPPTGGEEGLYYGLNLSGTEQSRISRAQLGGETARIVQQESEAFDVPDDLLLPSTYQNLCYFVASRVKTFVMKEDESSVVSTSQGQKKLGCSYSFSTAVDECNASAESPVKSMKSFLIENAEDFASELNSALAKHGLDYRVSTLVDDTVGNFTADKYHNNDVVAAITMGMGTNSAYLEKEIEVSKWKGSPTKSGELVIDIGWGSFSCSHLPMTEFDVCLDTESLHPGEQIFEKLISGMYLGDIVRRVLLKMATQTALFGETVPPKLTAPYVLRSPDMAAMHQDTSENRDVVEEKLKDVFGITDSTPMVREVVAEVCDVVVERAARLAAAGIVGILKKLGRTELKQRSVVTVEGGLYQHYRLFRNYLHSGVWEMLGNEFSDYVVIENSNGGSGLGAVFLAATHSNSFQDS